VSNLCKVFYLTFALSGGWGLDIASSRQGQSLGLVDCDSQWRCSSVKNLTQALWLWAHNSGKLRAALWRRGGGVAGDVVQARWQAHQRICATWWLCRSTCTQHAHHHQNHTHLHPLFCHSIRMLSLMRSLWNSLNSE